MQSDNAIGDICILLLYERLPNFCYMCGKLGHLQRDYDVQESEENQPSFGNWLRALTGPGDRKGSNSLSSSPISSGSTSDTIKASVDKAVKTNTNQDHYIIQLGDSKETGVVRRKLRELVIWRLCILRVQKFYGQV